MSKAILAIDRIVTHAVWLLAAGLLAVVSCLGLYQVLMRFVLNQPSPWTEELIGRLLIWMVMFGVAAAFRRGALVSVDVLLRLARGGLRRALRRLILAASLFFLGVIAWVGFDLAWRVRFQTFAALPISMTWAYLALPVGASFSMLAVIAHYFDPIDREPQAPQ
ncbi:MAG: TRAP transporter small permease [Burkholderiaceae bacterium]